jgi:hypothetical protein
LQGVNINIEHLKLFYHFYRSEFLVLVVSPLMAFGRKMVGMKKYNIKQGNKKKV